jgi:polar amino acid transport system substrate-binding protein
MFKSGNLLALILIACTQHSYAAELKFITIDVAPWASVDAKTGASVGVFPEVVREIERRTGHTIEMQFTPFARVDRELQSGRQDCTILVSGDKRAGFVEEGALVSYHPIGVIARKGVTLKTYADLKPLTISVLRGAAMTPEFEADDSLRKEFDTDYLIGLRKIEHGRLDAIAGAVPTIRYLASQEGNLAHLGDEIILANVPLVLQCSRKSTHLPLMPALNNAIEDMKLDGVLDKIKAKFYF